MCIYTQKKPSNLSPNPEAVMFSSKELPSTSSLFSAYASVMLFRSMANEILPAPVRSYLLSTLQFIVKRRKTDFLTLVIDEFVGMTNNQVYDASHTYLCAKLSSKAERLKLVKSLKDTNLTLKLEKTEKVVDFYQDIEFHWKFTRKERERNNNNNNDRDSPWDIHQFELSFDRKHKDFVMNVYVPYVLEKAKEIQREQKPLKMFTLNRSPSHASCIRWDSVNLEHPSTFETMAMDSDLKKIVIDDIDRFMKRREYYKRVGRAWKRGYLLYGPPGTGKSSLVAAMANYLKFDVYDLQLANLMRDSDLRQLLLTTSNRSILVIEDIDCSVHMPARVPEDGNDGKKQSNVQMTLSGLLNFIDGLWSSCGDERIIIFTTNHKEKLDPALLRPGRMDMHIHLSYCNFQGFKTLASNYLGVNSTHKLFPEIEQLMDNANITPAQVAEEMMKSEDSDVALEELVKVLKRKKLEEHFEEDQDAQKRTKTSGGANLT